MHKNTDKSDNEIYYENIKRFMSHLYFQRVICERNFDDLIIHAGRSLEQTDFTHINDCWMWDGAVFVKKRARDEDRKLPRLNITDPITRKKKDVYARRFAYEQVWGSLNGESLGLYRCEEDLCVNPGHGVRFAKDRMYQIKGELRAAMVLRVDGGPNGVLQREIDENAKYKKSRSR